MKSILHGRRFQTSVFAALLGIGTFVLYLPAANFDFVHLDDHGYISHNLLVNQGLSLQSIYDSFTMYSMSNWHPVTWLSYLLDFELYGLDPGGYHLTNIVFHAVNSVLLFGVLHFMTGARWKSFFVAALFAWHPLHVESVAWISERKDVLFAFFWFLSMWSYTRYVRKETVLFYLLTVVFVGLSLMSKPMAVTLPCVLLLLDLWPLRRFDGADINKIRRILIEKLPLILFSLFTCYQTMLAQGNAGAIASLDRLGAGARITNSFIAYGAYLRMTLWPTGLGVLYPHTLHAEYGKALLAGLGLLIVGILAIRHLKRKPYYAAGWFWYLGTLIPVIGILQVGAQSMADRYTYIPLVGIFIMMAWALNDLIKWKSYLKHAVILACCSSLAGCLYLTRSQVTLWNDTSTLFSHTLAVTKDNWKAHFCLSCPYVEDRNWPEAERHLRKALALLPDSNRRAKYHIKLSQVLIEQKKYDEAFIEIEKALKIKPDYLLAYHQLGYLYRHQNDPEKALSYYRKCLVLNPYSCDAMDEMAWILSTSPDAGVRDGQVAEHLCEKIMTFFKKPPPHYLCTLAAAYAERGQFDKAVNTAEKALDKAQRKKNPDAALIQQITAGLDQYRQGRPYRDRSTLTD